ncbi:protein translocase subunit SecD [Metallumcola ferriviriculae]|uniref:Protein translocase subunit SecD n=1 Tax=Metallumcola ferriviriculae TaxID=3039180 RepID=A0AAU0USE5_9FIRM|nr:protein translocase subunit SecD [Desulfitibacteraceae bacterium MK1]
MNSGKLMKLAFVIVLVLVVGVLLYNPIMNAVNLGLDLQGGVHVVLKAVKEKTAITDEDMQQLKTVMRERVDELGVSEPVIQVSGNDRLIVEVAGVEDPEQAVDLIGKTAMLQFKTSDGKTVLTGKDLKDAKAVINNSNGQAEIQLQFNSEGAKKFGDVTSRLVQNYQNNDPRRAIAIYLDEDLLTNPNVNEAIPSGTAVITGNRNFEEASNIAALLRGGALPVNVEIMEKRTVGPTLGANSLNRSVNAILYSLIAIVLFIILYYRVPGLVAAFSLLVYAIIVMGGLASINAVLTLPGIAGLLLSIAFAVDANIIIYERLKEELKNGKTIRAAIEAGFGRAFWTIFDANTTTLLAAAVLFYYGTGPIRGFAVTLGIGILASMFTAITFTRFLLRLLADTRLVKNTKMYGA